MPYVITTTVDRAPDWPGAQSRRAVATLEEARAAAESVIYRVSGEYEDARFGVTEAHYPLAQALPETGGTIGPLPDGAVIEVAPITRRALWEALDAATQDRLRAGRLTATDVTDAEIIDAYNAQHAH